MIINPVEILFFFGSQVSGLLADQCVVGRMVQNYSRFDCSATEQHIGFRNLLLHIAYCDAWRGYVLCPSSICPGLTIVAAAISFGALTEPASLIMCQERAAVCFSSWLPSRPMMVGSSTFCSRCSSVSFRNARTGVVPRLATFKRHRVTADGVIKYPVTPVVMSQAGTTSDFALHAAMFLAGPVLNVFTVVMVVRIVLTWYPKTDLRKAPWIYLAVPTEPLLEATRQLIKPVGGVDISPIVWVAISTFVHEILMGPQGVLVLLSRK